MWFRSNLSLPNSSRPDRLRGLFTPTNKSQCNKDPYCPCYFFFFFALTRTIPAINSPKTSTWILQYVDDSKLFRVFFTHTKKRNTNSNKQIQKNSSTQILKKICPFSVLKVTPSLQCYEPYYCHSRNCLIKFWQVLLTIKWASQSRTGKLPRAEMSIRSPFNPLRFYRSHNQRTKWPSRWKLNTEGNASQLFS